MMAQKMSGNGDDLGQTRSVGRANARGTVPVYSEIHGAAQMAHEYLQDNHEKRSGRVDTDSVTPTSLIRAPHP